MSSEPMKRATIEQLAQALLTRARDDFDREAASRLRQLEALVERLRREAETHAQEARTQRSTVLEIYQAVTGRKGEPGNWNGSKWIADKFAELLADRDRLEWYLKNYGQLDRTLDQWRAWIDRQRGVTVHE